ncbi:uncharacterized protein LOC119190732 [Manduca sexta]|uniref:uncharacterized protein LOC119190732 n=1 Tax=Manduca sexta TaxID=7130 RepID=UPI00188EA31B|nr:uncharacterized protein LOC119190732 [Manduca sexta]
MPVICAGCHMKIPNRKFIACYHCKSTYDLQCGNITDKKFNLMTAETRATWKCHNCRNNQSKIMDIPTPVRNGQTAITSTHYSSNSLYNTSDIKNTSKTKNSTPQEHHNSPPGSIYVTEDAMRDLFDHFKTDICKIIKQTVTEVVVSKFIDISQQINEFKESLSFFNDKFESVMTNLRESTATIDRLQSDNAELKSTVKDLSVRLNLAEQHLRDSNVELHGIPEHRGENLVNCLTQLCTTVGAAVTENDFTQVTRVAKLDKDSTRPRTVIAKLRTPRQRDILLAAVYNFNKKNPESKLNSQNLGIGGKIFPVFVAEHLTPSNKSLHAEARKKAKESNYKYVWVRNGRIYVRKDDTCQALLIRSTESIKLIK